MPKTIDEIADSVEKGVAAIQKTNEELTTKVGNLQTETKKAFEDLTLVKNGQNDLAKTIQAVQKVQTAMQLERRLAFGDPIERVLANEEIRNWLNASARAATGMRVDKMPQHLQKALTGADSGLGQELVPTGIAQEIYSLLAMYGRWSSLGVKTIGLRTESQPIKTARPRAYWLGPNCGSGKAEGDEGTEGSYGGGSVSLVIQTIIALLSVSEEELADSTVDLSREILNDFVEAANYALDFAAFTANGGADQDDAGYYGIFEAAAIHTGCKAEAAAGNISVSKLDLEDFVRCLTTVSDTVLMRNAKWWSHPTNVAKFCLLRDANKRPIFQTALEAPAPGGIGSVLGYPVIPVSAAPSTDAASAKIATFGDPMAQVVALRQQFEFAQSEHVGFKSNLRWFRAKMRAGVKMRIPTGNPAAHKPFAVLTLPAA